MNNKLFIQPARWSFRDFLQSRKDRKKINSALLLLVLNTLHFI